MVSASTTEKYEIKIVPQNWKFSNTTLHISWVEDKRTLNLPALSLTTIHIPHLTLGSEMMNKGSWDMASAAVVKILSKQKGGALPE